MGSGKSSAILSMINQDQEGNYVYVTPFLSEVERVIEATNHRLKQPHNIGNGKLDSLHKLLTTGESIVTTHALFLTATQETIQLIREGGYTLILDEVLDVFREYNDIVKSLDNKVVTKGDVHWLIQEGYISVSPDYRVTWNGATADDFHYSEVERLAKNGSLRCIDNALYWEYPTDIFAAFKSVYVLTYRFESSILASYMRIYNLPYEKVSATRSDDGSFQLCPYTDDLEQRSALSSLINIYIGELNNIGKKPNAFSVNWLQSLNSSQIHSIRNLMRNYKERLKAPSSSIMWTTTKQYGVYEKLERTKGFKFVCKLTAEDKNLSDTAMRKLQCFVPCTSRATNDYSGRTTLLYMLNRYPSPEIDKYFSRLGAPINAEEYATSELIQWIWRSAIRGNKGINIYIPSSRMRNLLISWLGLDTPPYQPRPRKVLEKA